MKVGDLVKCDTDPGPWRVGVIVRFDKDEDPVVCYYNETPETITESFYHWHVEVIDGTN